MQTPRIGKRNLGRWKNRYMDSAHTQHDSGHHGGTSTGYFNIKQNTSLSTTSSSSKVFSSYSCEAGGHCPNGISGYFILSLIHSIIHSITVWISKYYTSKMKMCPV
jgi:hypothetical protein